VFIIPARLFTTGINRYAVRMKHNLWLFSTVLLLSLALWGCNGNGSGGSGSSKEENFDKDASYALGMDIASSLASSGIVPNLNELIQGMRDSLSGAKTRLDPLEIPMKLQTAYSSMMEKRNAEAIQKEVAFLAENSKKPGMVITASGLQYEVVEDGKGPKPQASDTVKVNYEGRLIDGTVFDSSYARGEPAEFPLEWVIPGWTEGIQLMGVGSKYKLYIPSELAYGPEGGGPIPPYSPLIFDVELLEIVK